MIETVDCPHCGEELKVKSWTETHKVHNGLGMQTVGQDNYTEIIDGCDCELYEDDMEYIYDEVVEQHTAGYQDYADQRYHEMKEEGRL